MHFTHVLVPTDLSPMAPHIVWCACEAAIRHDAKVTLLHVVASRPETVVYYVSALPSPALRFDPILGGPLGMPKTPPPTVILHDPQEDTLRRLRDLIPALCYSDCEIVVAAGNPVDVIVHVAQTRAVDLIVMGTHGYTGLRHILWGKGFALRRRRGPFRSVCRASIAAKVIRLAPCPVLVVRPQEESDQTATTTLRSHYSIASTHWRGS